MYKIFCDATGFCYCTHFESLIRLLKFILYSRILTMISAVYWCILAHKLRLNLIMDGRMFGELLLMFNLFNSGKFLQSMISPCGK